MRKRKPEHDARIRTNHFSWREFLITYFVLSVLSAGQWLIYAEYMDFTTMPAEYIFGMLGYWALVAGGFSLITHFQIRKKFEEPLHRLGDAAKDVANGNFSIYVEPVHTADKYDYMDVMFEDFNKMVQELGSIETLKSDFIANVSHEIKTPLSVIQNYAEALQKENLPYEVRREYSATIITASQKLTALVSNILKLNKLENQEITAAMKPYDLCRQLTDCALQFEDLWEKKNIRFVAELEDRAIITADEEMLGIVWQNLLSNAVKFTPQGGMITLTQISNAQTVTVMVADTGCGMNRQVVDKIFDKFYQGDASRSQEGNGLGLALALRVIELMDGAITVASEPGKGTTFTVVLPVSR
jgi:signal transduction histidine kinase